MSSIESGILNLSSMLEGQDKTIDNTLIKIDLIEEDINQPRKEFNKESLNELINSVKERGVKTPISVRENSNKDGYIINHGARRFRAAKEAGLTEIPAFIDNNYEYLDQLVENIQRDDLLPFEIANALSELHHKGYKKTEIANLIGKSNAYVSQYLALLNMPNFILKWLESGKINDVTVANDLTRLYKKHGQEIEDNLSNINEINRQTVKELKDFYSSGQVEEEIDTEIYENNNTLDFDDLGSPGENSHSEYGDLLSEKPIVEGTEKKEKVIDPNEYKIKMTITYAGQKYPFEINDTANIEKVLKLIDFYSIIEK